MVDFFITWLIFILKHPRQQIWRSHNFSRNFHFFPTPPSPRGDEHTVAAAGGALIKLWEMSNLGADSGKTTEREASPGF